MGLRDKQIWKMSDGTWKVVYQKKVWLTPPPVYVQQKFGVTRHWLWIMGSPYGEKGNFEKTTLCLHEFGRRAYPELGRKGLRWDGKPA